MEREKSWSGFLGTPTGLAACLAVVLAISGCALQATKPAALSLPALHVSSHARTAEGAQPAPGFTKLPPPFRSSGPSKSARPDRPIRHTKAPGHRTTGAPPPVVQASPAKSPAPAPHHPAPHRPAPPRPSAAGPGPNLAAGAIMTASGFTQTYVPANANDGNPSSYWESTDNAFPQWLDAQLSSAHTVRSLVLRVPPSNLWLARTQTISVLGSQNGTSWSTVKPSAGYDFRPVNDNTVTIDLPASQVRYLRLDFTGNTDWPAGQISEFEIFSGQ